MASITDLFNQKKTEIYNEFGKGNNIFIESRGTINTARAAAIVASSPNSVGDLIGGAIVAGTIGGTANRPSDTIFGGTGVFSKPATLITGGSNIKELLRNSVKSNKDYFVKPAPSATTFAADLRNGKSPVNTAIGVLTSGELGNIVNSLKKKKESDDYGPKFQSTQLGRKPLPTTKKFSENYTKYDSVYVNGQIQYSKGVNHFGNELIGSIESRESQIPKISPGIITGATLAKSNTNNYFDVSNTFALSTLSGDRTNLTDKEFEDFRTTMGDNKNTYVLFKPYGRLNDNILLPSTIKNISEEITSEITDYKYIGSPFKNYKYTGVERSLSFELQMYYLDNDTKESMIKNLDKIRKMTFPEEDVSVTTYALNKVSQISFVQPMMYLTISGLYNNLLVMVESLSFSIDENTSWSVTDDDMSGVKSEPYPSVINISFNIKIIEQTQLKENKLSYTFTGRKAPNNKPDEPIGLPKSDIEKWTDARSID